MYIRVQTPLKPTYLVYFILLLACCISCSDTNEKKPAPNFIIIFTDDQGYGDLGCFGHPTIKTPNLDQVAAEGQKWTQFYVAAPVCTPSRAALMTGRYPARNGMTSAKRVVLFPNSAGGLPQSEITIAEVLKQENYATGIIGKWHLGHLPSYLPTRQGFDYFYGVPYSNDMNALGNMPSYWDNSHDPYYQARTDQFDVPLLENLEVIERPVDQTTITRRYTEKAVEFIKTNKDRPFFLYLAHSMPHIPLFAHKDFEKSSKQGLYGDVIQEIDWSVGQVLHTLYQLGLENNTIVVFSSDNGPWLAYKSHGGSAGPLRGGKGTTFEGGQRVPTIFWGPGYIKPGVVDELGSTLDLIHTFASFSNTKIPGERKMDGYDLSPVLQGVTAESPRSTFFYWSRAELHAVRSGRWKLYLKQHHPINYGKESISLEKPELYDLQADISERYDLSAQHPGIADSLRRLMEHHKASFADSLPDHLAARIE